MRPTASAIATALLAATLAPGAMAACYADYKAKQDDPLRLHYGVIELPAEPCTVDAAQAALAQRLGEGWELLQVLGTFDADGLDQRRTDAGDYFLRY